MSRRVLFLLLVHILSIASYYGYKYINNKDQQVEAAKQSSVLTSGVPSFTSNVKTHTRVLLDYSKDLEETGTDCSKCEHSKIPPSDPQFWINIVVIICSQGSHKYSCVVQE